MKEVSSRPQKQWAAIILAGGEGSRLRPLTRKIAGHEVPKQFCAVISEESLLEQTLRRVSLQIEARRTIVAVTRKHERFYSTMLGGLPERNLVIQPQNRGTAPALIYSLLRLAETAPQAKVAIFPSDHYVSDDQSFMRHVERAFAASALRPELTVLLGITPECAETSYGWIEAGAAIGETSVFKVERFWEKPDTELATELFHRGSLWNSFVMVGQLSALLSLFLMAMPDLYRAFKKVNSRVEKIEKERTVEDLYARLPSTGFSEHVLTRYPAGLAVLPVRGVQWSDLGEPSRVMETISRSGIRPRWAAA